MAKMDVNKEEDQLRKLDTAREATIDLVALNNMVVNMRSVVKSAKVQVIHKLTRMIQKLKSKKGTEQQQEKNLRKAQRMLDEIFVIKALNADAVSKFALANRATYADVCKQPSVSSEMRSLLRLSEHRLLANRVKAFREEHSDWETLAAFLKVKRTGRRFKTKEQKERAARKHKSVEVDPIPEKTVGEGRLTSARNVDSPAPESTNKHHHNSNNRGNRDTQLFPEMKDDQWLRGDAAQRENDTGRGWSKRDAQRGRGSGSSRRGSFKAGGPKGQVSKKRGDEGTKRNPQRKDTASHPSSGAKRRRKELEPKATFSEKDSKSSSQPEDSASHPSWDAKRRRRELEQKATFTGTRITFNDD